MSHNWKPGEQPATPYLKYGLKMRDVAALRNKFNQLLISSPRSTPLEMSLQFESDYVDEERATIWMKDSKLTTKRTGLEKEVVIREDFKNVPTSLGHIVRLFSREIIGRLADGEYKEMKLSALLAEQRRCLEMVEKYARLMKDFNKPKDEDKEIDVLSERVKAQDTESS